MAEDFFGAYHLADASVRAAYQPVRQNNFVFYIDFSSNAYIAANGLVKPGKTKEQPGGLFDLGTTGDALKFSVVSFKPPHFTQDKIEVKRGNSTIYYAGVPTFGDNSLKIDDFAGADGKSILMAWQALSYDINNDTIASSDQYKVDAAVYEYLPDGTLIRYWVLEGCWVTGIEEDEWNAEQSGKKTVTATIRFDKAKMFLN